MTILQSLVAISPLVCVALFLSVMYFWANKKVKAYRNKKREESKDLDTKVSGMGYVIEQYSEGYCVKDKNGLYLWWCEDGEEWDDEGGEYGFLSTRGSKQEHCIYSATPYGAKLQLTHYLNQEEAKIVADKTIPPIKTIKL